ncbi:MAG: biopolymer transporter ExbD [Candidatus Omnitrophota bacterium]|jgi:biopolymer transport protein ExbD
MIRIEGRKDYLVALESVAMTDIVMNLFIFFFISFSILYTFNPVRVSKLDIRLPKAQSAVQLEGSEKIILSISRGGKYYLGDVLVHPKGLKKALVERLKENPKAALLLKVDSLTRFDHVANALDVINGLDIKKVSVATVKNNNER